MRHTTIERELAERGKCIIQTVGISMEPILHNRDTTVLLEKARAPLRRGDVVLFRRDQGNAGANCDYVLHRIVGIRKNAFLIRGDNALQTELCPESHVLGVMRGFYNGDHFTDCQSDSSYARYVRTLRFRYAGKCLRALCAAALRRVKCAFGCGARDHHLKGDT